MNANLRKFLTEDLRVKHTKGGRYALTCSGHDESFKSLDDMAVFINGNSAKWKTLVNWTNFTIDEHFTEDPMKFTETLNSKIVEELSSIMTKKANKMTKLSESDTEGDAFDSFSKTVTELPNIGFNQIDKLILQRLRYCKEDDSLYISSSNGLKLIDRLGAVQRDPSINGLCAIIKESVGFIANQTTPKGIDEYISDCVKNINWLKGFLSSETMKRRDANEKWEDITIEIDESHEPFVPKMFSSDEVVNCIEIACDAYCLKEFWKMVPGSLFSARIIELKAKYTTHDRLKDNGDTYKQTVFNNFFWNVVRSGESLTELRYLKNVLGEFVAEIKDDACFKLEHQPRTYADTDCDALFRFTNETLAKNLPKNSFKTLDECENLKVLKKWMNEDEFRLAMAWAYTAVHPTSKVSNIALLLWTGGGSYKSSLAAIIKEAICMGSGAKASDIYFEIKGNKFDEDQRNWVPDGEIGVTRAALVNIDEATTKSIELYKDFSGSAAGNKLSTRKNYENTIVTTVKGKFLFTTNKGLQLTTDDGSLLRRVAIIKHPEAKNLMSPNKKTDDEIIQEYKKQVFMMLKLGKEALQEIERLGYASLDHYAMTCENITKNLKESTATMMNVQIYEWIWDKLLTMIEAKRDSEGAFRLQGSALKKLYDDVCAENSEDARFYGSFKNFILEQFQLFTMTNERKQAKNFLLWDRDSESFSCKHSNCSSIYILHPLKSAAPEPKPTEEDSPEIWAMKQEAKEKAEDEDMIASLYNESQDKGE